MIKLGLGLNRRHNTIMNLLPWAESHRLAYGGGWHDLFLKQFNIMRSSFEGHRAFFNRLLND